MSLPRLGYKTLTLSSWSCVQFLSLSWAICFGGGSGGGGGEASSHV